MNKLNVLDTGGAKPREITANWDRDVSAPVWSQDSKTIYFLSDDRGDVNLYEIGIHGGMRQVVTTGHRRFASLSVARGRPAVVYITSTEPPALATFSLDAPGKLNVIVAPNAQMRMGCQLSGTEEIWYEPFGGRRIKYIDPKPRTP